ncbi:MAG: carbohydrate-binding protein [Proteobacteria bacterium]|nr:carbohydrate-binding protein [Pseudomonadota bacterium]
MSDGLTVVKPLTVTPAMLVSSSVPETDYPEWAAGTTYANGARVILAAQHRVYQSMADGNVGNNPAATVSIKWVEVGATNRWKPFDRSVSTKVQQSGSISYRIRPGATVTSVSLLNLTGSTSVRVRIVTPDDVTRYDQTVSTSRVPLEAGWWAWYFGVRHTPTQVLLQDLPSYPNGDILIDLAGDADLGVGVIALGQLRRFAMGVQMGVRVGIQDYSRKERNDFGDVVVVERAFAKRANFSMLLTSSEVDALHLFLADVRATPCIWIISKSYESAVVYGFYKNFDIVISYTNYSDCDIELEGLT